MTTDPVRRWSVVLPLKRGTFAKSRLEPYARHHRPDLARAMAIDTVAAVLACADVSEAIVVTSDRDAARALAEIGARIVDDVPDAGLNAALVHGADHARQDARAALSADLPALRPDDLAAALRAAGAHSSSFVPDHAGTGTTLYCAGPGRAFAPRYGIDSAAAHRRGGAVALAAAPSLRRDVDVAADLVEATVLGVGEQTAAMVGLLDSRPPA